MKPAKARQINLRVEERDLEIKELLKSKGVDVAELYRQAIRQAGERAIEALQAG